MTKSDELHKNDYSENAVEIHQLQAPNRTSRKDEVSNIKHDLIYLQSKVDTILLGLIMGEHVSIYIIEKMALDI